MPWFKVDDALHSHEKTIGAASDSIGREAMGLWVVAGSWAAANLTDGRISLAVVRRLGWNKRHADRLVAIGFWHLTDGNDYIYHDWEEYQPSREAIAEKRRSARERMQRVRANTRRTHGERSRELRSTPTRPDPTRPDPDPSPPTHTRAREDRPPEPALEYVPHDPVAAQIGADMIAAVTSCLWEGGKHLEHLRWIGTRPKAERDTAVAGLRREEWVRNNPGLVTPEHVRAYWPRYTAPQPDRRTAAERRQDEELQAILDAAEARERAKAKGG